MKFLPLCPVYGIGATILLLIKPVLPQNKLIYFLVGLILCSAVEYFFNSFFKTAFNIKVWDYSNSKYNINGNISLSYSLIWGLMSMIVLNFAENILSFLSLFPNLVTFFLLFCFTIDFFESMYLFKKYEIKLIKKYCMVMDTNKKA